MAFQKGVSIMKHVTQQEYKISISPLENAFIAHFSSIGGCFGDNGVTLSLCHITSTFD